ncbi:DNA-binding transcriptional regulator YhcF, GntR family [Tindallia magadiensis]|uniref:DNA-binding transcriptional regulator YhcF, GntR family n=1 Tax=Tindallia magadiensis TaxID=69895 RepID=A0A1I3EHC2_9FIRM|nr:GntR family transcriptional regulator [Tindallia magadiensis]SFH98389.1 DNA-binding transcriptional regulator YhcF, GntR family [Tindallia magadiensis]
MKFFEGTDPIYVQIADWLENEILSEQVKAGEKIYSQYKLADIFGINPATALKGLNRLVEKNLVYKKRGLGMFVEDDALEILKKERRDHGMRNQIRDLVEEAKRLDVSKDILMEMIEKEIEKAGDSNDSM